MCVCVCADRDRQPSEWACSPCSPVRNPEGPAEQLHVRVVAVPGRDHTMQRGAESSCPGRLGTVATPSDPTWPTHTPHRPAPPETEREKEADDSRWPLGGAALFHV